MRRKNDLLPMLTGGVLAVAFLITLIAKGGWMIWFPVIVALLVFFYLRHKPSH